jgi:hypothetical protein
MPEEIPWNSSLFPEKSSPQVPRNPGTPPALNQPQGYRTPRMYPPAPTEIFRAPTRPLRANQWLTQPDQPFPPTQPLQYTARLYQPFPAAPISQPAARPARPFSPPQPVRPVGGPAQPTTRTAQPFLPVQTRQESTSPARPSSPAGAAQLPAQTARNISRQVPQRPLSAQASGIVPTPPHSPARSTGSVPTPSRIPARPTWNTLPTQPIRPTGYVPTASTWASRSTAPSPPAHAGGLSPDTPARSTAYTPAVPRWTTSRPAPQIQPARPVHKGPAPRAGDSQQISAAASEWNARAGPSMYASGPQTTLPQTWTTGAMPAPTLNPRITRPVPAVAPVLAQHAQNTRITTAIQPSQPTHSAPSPSRARSGWNSWISSYELLLASTFLLFLAAIAVVTFYR